MKSKKMIIIASIMGLALSSIGVLGVYAMSNDDAISSSLPQEGEQGYLGITVYDTENGVQVRWVEPRSGAAEAGIEREDIITAVDGEPIESSEQLQELIADQSAGNTLTLSILRDDEGIDIEVTLGSLRSQVEIFAQPPNVFEPRGEGPVIFNNRFDADRYQLGVAYRSLTPAIAENEGLPTGEGALITNVIEDSPASDGGLQENDIIIAVDGDAVDIEHTLSDRLYAYEAEDQVNLTVLRDGETLEIGVVLATDHPNKRFNQELAFSGSIDIPPIPGFDVPPIPYEIEAIPFTDGFDFFEGELIPFDGDLHFEGGTFSFPEFDLPDGLEPSELLMLSCTNDDGSTLRLTLTMPLLSDGEVVTELPTNVLESFEDAGYTCQITTTPFNQFGSSEDGENF